MQQLNWNFCFSTRLDTRKHKIQDSKTVVDVQHAGFFRMCKAGLTSLVILHRESVWQSAAVYIAVIIKVTCLFASAVSYAPLYSHWLALWISEARREADKVSRKYCRLRYLRLIFMLGPLNYTCKHYFAVDSCGFTPQYDNSLRNVPLQTAHTQSLIPLSTYVNIDK